MNKTVWKINGHILYCGEALYIKSGFMHKVFPEPSLNDSIEENR